MWAAGKPASWGDRRRPSRSSRGCGGSPRAGHWPDPDEPRRGCGCEEPDPVCPNNRGAWRDRPNRWLVAYSGLANQGYDHQPRSISASGDPALIVMPRVHRVAALLDRWWLGIHHGAIDADHLDSISTRLHFPIQSPPFAGSWPAGLPTAPAGGAARAGPLQGPSRRSSQPRKPNVGDTRAKWIPSSEKRTLRCV